MYNFIGLLTLITKYMNISNYAQVRLAVLLFIYIIFIYLHLSQLVFPAEQTCDPPVKKHC